MPTTPPPHPDPDAGGGATPAERRAVIGARRAMDRRVLSVVERMSDAFLSFDANWRVEYANHEAGRLNGCSAESLVGADHWTRWPETVGSEVERRYRHAVAARVPVQFEHYYAASGVCHDIRAYPSEDGGLAVFYRDISRQKAIEAERLRQARELSAAHDKAFAAETQFRLLVDRVRDYAIFLLDPDGIVTHWGPGAERMKGYRPEEIVGRHLSVLYPPDEETGDGGADEHLRAAAESGEYIGEGMRLKQSGERFPARVVLTALRRGGEVVGFSKITQDLTGERQRQALVREAMRAAEAANRAKSQFLANTSHEIRTPLNAVIGYSELLALGIAGPLGAQQHAYLERIRSTSGHLLALINDVLDLSRVEAGAMRTAAEPVGVRAAVSAALQLVAPQAALRRIRLTDACAARPDAVLLGDAERVRQILVNLLSNAVRFTEPGGRVTIRCRAGEPPPPPAAAGPGAAPAGWVAIAVSDTGIGIAPAELERVWDAFVQVDATHTRAVGGSGLGLSISRHLARLMGGDVVAESVMGEGSTFTLWLPAAEPGAVPAPTAPSRPAGAPDGPTPAPADPALLPQDPATAAALRELGDVMLVECDRLLEDLVARLRADPRTARTRTLSDTTVANHVSTFVADLAHCLSAAGGAGVEALPTLRDGTAIQRLIAQRHGEQRARLGFSEAELLAELELLDATVAEWFARLAGGGDGRRDAGREAGRALLAQLVARASAEVLSAHRAARERRGAGAAEG